MAVVIKVVKIIAIGLLAIPVAFVGISLLMWAASFANGAPEQDKCSFGAVKNDEYQRLLANAKQQTWTVWPGLSKGLFMPSDRWFSLQFHSNDKRIGDELHLSITRLTPDRASTDEKIAAAHAVMRSIGAEYDNTSTVPEPYRNPVFERVSLVYFIPQRRFAPLCIFCFLWPQTTILVVFHHELATGVYHTEDVVILHGNLKYDPVKLRTQACPTASSSITLQRS